MLIQNFCSSPPAQLLSSKGVLAVMPLTKHCEPSTVGLIESGVCSVGSQQQSEVWLVEGEVTRGVVSGELGVNHWSKAEGVICVAHWLSEAQCSDLEVSVCNAYLSIFSVLEEHQLCHPFRFWNYLPNINAGVGDEETYKRFCTGRLRAFNALGIKSEGFPSASALGHHSQGAVIYAFASAAKPVNLNNNKQVDAYNYPRQYGITSPSFTRATSLELFGESYLFISGTASIVGHETVEVGSLERQLEVTLSNIKHILETANPKKKKLSTFKVYLRHAEDLLQTSAWLTLHYPYVDTIITLADICRSDLLVEIECFCK
ncbi:chorismate transformation enzyme, FkbO/Hyg5 family [Eionea flava]